MNYHLHECFCHLLGICLYTHEGLYSWIKLTFPPSAAIICQNLLGWCQDIVLYSFLHAGIWPGMGLYRSCACCHSSCEFICWLYLRVWLLECWLCSSGRPHIGEHLGNTNWSGCGRPFKVGLYFTLWKSTKI